MRLRVCISTLVLTAALASGQTAGYLWTPNGGANALESFDPSTGAISGGVSAPAASGLVFVANDGVTVLAPLNKQVTLFSGVTGQTIATVNLPDYTYVAAFSPDGTKAYLSGSHSIMVLDLSTLQVTHYRVPGTVGALAVSPDGTKLYAAVKTHGSGTTGSCKATAKRFTGLCEFDTTSFQVLAQKVQFYGPIAVSQDGKTVYAMPLTMGSLYALDSSTLKTTATIIAANNSALPFAMNMSPAGNTAVVFTQQVLLSNMMVEASLLDTQTNQLTTLYTFDFKYPTLLGAPDSLISSSASFSRDGTSLWMISVNAPGTPSPTLVGIAIPSGAPIASTNLPVSASQVIF